MKLWLTVKKMFNNDDVSDSDFLELIITYMEFVIFSVITILCGANYFFGARAMYEAGAILMLTMVVIPLIKNFLR